MKPDRLIGFMFASALASIDLGSDQTLTGRFFTHTHQPKPGRKCRLPECNETTTHNGGYCCAEHCRLHRRRGW